MIIRLTHNGIHYTADLSTGTDISLPLLPDQPGVNCFYAPTFDAQPVVMGNFVGSTKQGGAVNFKNVKINPHGNGTHTECVGHISVEDVSINDTLRQFHFIAELISVFPQKSENADRVITEDILRAVFTNETKCEALVIRTLPNDDVKKTFHYSGTNPPYLSADAISYLVNSCNIRHLLVDLPSVDREEDGGKLAGHKSFWKYPEMLDLNKTITELVYIDNTTKDGLYLLNLQIASFGIDASPGKPVLYKLYKE